MKWIWNSLTGIIFLSTRELVKPGGQGDNGHLAVVQTKRNNTQDENICSNTVEGIQGG